MKEKVLVIIPAYNEEKNIEKTYRSIINYNSKNKANYDVIVINDGSCDKTYEKLSKNSIPNINLIQNLGIGGAVQTGYKYACINNYDIAVQFDGDGQHDVNYISEIIKPIINKSANMVIGSRFIIPELKGFKSSTARRCGIKIISSIIKFLTGIKVYDPTSGFRAVDKNIIKLFADNYPTEYPEPVTEVSILKQKYIINEVAVVMHCRTAGKSSISAWKNVYYMFNVTLAMLIESIKRFK
jgi:glycosyltransferase involved in cell wall biosynthesis